MYINVPLMHISTKGNILRTKYTINAYPLNYVSGAMYLGNSMSSKMSLTTTLTIFVQKKSDQLV